MSRRNMHIENIFENNANKKSKTLTFENNNSAESIKESFIHENKLLKMCNYEKVNNCDLDENFKVKEIDLIRASTEEFHIKNPSDKIQEVDEKLLWKSITTSREKK